MMRSQRRSRVIFFRVTEDELAEIESLRETTGARSVSDVVRSAVKDLIGAHAENTDKDLGQRVLALTEAVGELERVVRVAIGTQRPDDKLVNNMFPTVEGNSTAS